jgi:glycerophosphoryl diester phosphodiesterase
VRGHECASDHTSELDDDNSQQVQHVAHDERNDRIVAMDVIGHRGGAALAPENTLAAIRAGLDSGADGVEIDVRLTSDRVAVLLHDPDVARTTSGTGRVGHLSSGEVRALGIPTLEEVLEVVPVDRLLIVEVKGTPWEPGHDPTEPAARVVAAALASGASRRVVVSSFNPLALAVVREISAELRTAVLTNAAFDLASNLAAAIAGANEECHVPADLIQPEFVQTAHEANRRVVAWTINDPDIVRSCAEWGVDGVITDDPRMARNALGR